MQAKNLNLICSALLLILVNFTSAQESIYQQELNKMVRIPNSPEAEAFAKYGDVDVSLYTGTPNINVPLHVISGREMDLPMSLTYDASGVKVEQLATWVGLSWNLNVGGRISRVANGLPDDYINGDYGTMNDGDLTVRQEIINNVNSYLANTSKQFSSEQAVRDYYFFLDDINKSFIDAQPDIYKVNAPGLNTTIVFDTNDNNAPKSLDNPRIRIDNVYRDVSRGNSVIIGWKITNEDGSVYVFGATNSSSGTPQNYETTKRNGDDSTPNGVIGNEYVSSWLLTKIESPNKKDVYDFSYFDSGYWSQSLQQSGAQKGTVTVLNDPNKIWYGTNEILQTSAGGAGYWISQQFVQDIEHNGHLIANFNRGSRSDIAYAVGANTRLSNIDIQDYTGGVLKTITLQNNSYFNQDDPNTYHRRLKLDGVQFKGKDDVVVQNYYFEYDRPDELVPRTDKGQDFAGYYNGVNNDVLFEKYEESGITFAGADRSPNSHYAKVGTLKKITYPTGGYTEFVFEGNLTQVNSSNQIEVFDLEISLDSDDPSNESFYLNSDGSAPDDEFSANLPHPKIKKKKFRIEAGQGPHTFSLYGSASNNDIKAYILPNDAGFSGSTFSEFLANGIHWSGDIKQIDQSFPQGIDPGKYIAILLLDEIDGTSNSYDNITLTVSHMENVTSSAHVELGGLRIKSTKSYASTGTFSNGKNYVYVEQNDTYKPWLSEIIEYGGQKALVRRVAFPQGDEPIVTYEKVREFQTNVSGSSEGYVEYEFHNQAKGLKPSYEAPYANDYYPSIKGGTLKRQTTLDSTGTTVATKDIEYFETFDRPINVKGMNVIYNDEFLGHYVYIKQVGSAFSYDYVPAIECQGGSGGQTDTRGGISSFGGLGFCEPIPCLNGFQDCGDYESFMDNTYGGLDLKSTFINGAYGGVSVTKDTLLFKDVTGTLSKVATLNETIYDGSIDPYYRPVSTKTVDSDGARYRQTFTYANDGASEYQELFNKNRLVEVVASQTEKLDGNDNVLEFISARKNEYFVSGNVVLPSKIFTSKESVATLEERINFSYYPNGNLKESNQINGPSSTYIWGYDDMYPVGKIDNAVLTEINGINYSTSILQDIASSDLAKRTELDKIRSGLTNTMVTSYTYIPGIGVTSMTDPRGYTTHYEYDDFNRLKEVKDADHLLIEDYQYHYKTQD